MARPRLEATVDPQLKRDVQQYANTYFGGNFSAAVEHLMKKGINVERTEAKRGMGYASVAATYLLLILAVF